MLNKNLTHEDAIKAIQALNNLIDETTKLINQNGIGYIPTENSKGHIELSTSKRAESISTALSQGSSLIEAAMDHVLALVRSLNEPALSIAPWSSARATLEACAISTWILDPRVDTNIRIQRSLAFRYDNLNEQTKIARLQKDSATETRLIQRIDDIENMALELGFDKVLDRKGKRIGIGLEMPKATSLIGETLNQEFTYRILSGIAHGQSWALLNLSFRPTKNPDYETPVKNDTLPIGANYIERNLEPFHIIYFCGVLAKAFAQTIYFASIMFGWNEEKWIAIVEKQLLEIGIKNYDLKSLIN